MPIPDYQTLMLPLLRVGADGKEHRFREAVDVLAQRFSLTAEERAVRLPSGLAKLFDNRVGWARMYLKYARLIESTKRGAFRITERGQHLLAKNPRELTLKSLEQYEEFRLARGRQRSGASSTQQQADPTEVASADRQTPEESLAAAYETLRQNLESEILDHVKAGSSGFFEHLVVDLLVAMGYGGSRQDAGRAIGRSGDEGIDGIIKEDRLGLDVIYIQAKRWNATVGRPEIQKFAGALQGQRANKGVFITTSTFSRDAREYANSINSKIILIDGEQLAELMVDHNIGVAPVEVYEIKKVDTDYFDEE